MDNPIIRSFGDSAILLTWKQEIKKEINDQVRNTERLIHDHFSEEILETTPTYSELAVYLKPQTNQTAFIANLRNFSWKTLDLDLEDHFLWQIPVCYSEEYGIDLVELATEKGVSIEEITRMHTSRKFSVYFIGFLPGFLYLGGLPDGLNHPRKIAPRLTVPKGAVAIGGKQTGIYPMESPGGWNIIGKTPIELFDVQQNPPVIIKSGDKIQFNSITFAEFKHIQSQVEAGNYELTKTRLL